jgi:hypothetical protein
MSARIAVGFYGYTCSMSELTSIVKSNVMTFQMINYFSEFWTMTACAGPVEIGDVDASVVYQK